MKNKYILLLLTLPLVLLCACSNDDTGSTETTPPESASVEVETETTAETEPEIQAAANTEHLITYHSGAISCFLDRAYRTEDYDAYLKWHESLPQEICCEGRCGGYLVEENIYRFIRDFSISREEFEEALYLEGYYYTDHVNLDILYNGTAEEASEAFSVAHFQEWDDDHLDKEDSIKYALRTLVWDTAGMQDT